MIWSPDSVTLDEPCKVPGTSAAYLQNEDSLQGAVLALNVWDIDTLGSVLRFSSLKENGKSPQLTSETSKESRFQARDWDRYLFLN